MPTITIRPTPGVGENPWGVQSMVPAAPVDEWAVKSVEPLGAPPVPGPAAPLGPPAPAAAPPAPAQPGAPPGPASPQPEPWAVQSVEPVAPPIDGNWMTDPKRGVFPMNYPAIQSENAGKAFKQMGEGVEQLGTSGERLKGGFNTAVGALGYTLSPIESFLQSVVGAPVEKATGLPHEYTDFGVGLALPGIGFAKTPKTIQRIFSPDTMSQGAIDAAALIRGRTGIAARDTETTAAALEPWQKPVSRLAPADQLGIMHYIEGTGPPPATPSLRALGDTLKAAFETRKAKLQAMPSHAQMGFVDEFFPHFWTDPLAAGNAVRSGGFGKQGSGASTKKRTVPTMQDGINAGLTPLTTNPIEAALRYTMSIDKFVASQEVLNAAKSTGIIRYVRPRTMGASGHPDSFKVPLQTAVGGQHTTEQLQNIVRMNDGMAPSLERNALDPHHPAATRAHYAEQARLLREQSAQYRTEIARRQRTGVDAHTIPPGYVELKGRGATDATGAKAFAPEDWARVYNNFISRGWEQVGGGEYGTAYNVLRRGANAITQMVLSFSGYHAFTMAEAAMSSQMAKTINALRRGKPGEAAKEVAKLPTSPVSYATQGKRVKNIYLGKSMPVSPADKEIVDLITEAGGRMANAKHALDYESSALGDYISSFQRGRLKAEMLAQGRDIKTNPIMGTVRTVASNIGRIMDTFNKPLFQHYIPLVKNGAAYEGMAQFLKANPGATQAEKLAAARKVVDSVDNRFGEMIHDNIFWHKVAKQSAMLAMLSYSWNMGAIRELGGGARDMARAAVGQGRWSPKSDYVVGMSLNWGIMSAVYQALKTGEAPKDMKDLAAPRTGGVDSRTGEPERIIPPGVMKDVYGYYEHFGQEILNKLNPGARVAGQTLGLLGGHGGSDWRGDPILSPREEGQSTAAKAPEWLAEYFRFIQKSMTPIQVQNMGRGSEEGSNLNPFELGLGIRTAPRQFVAPEQQERMTKGMWMKKWRLKERHDMKEQERFGGPVE